MAKSKYHNDPGQNFVITGIGIVLLLCVAGLLVSCFGCAQNYPAAKQQSGLVYFNGPAPAPAVYHDKAWTDSDGGVRPGKTWGTP